MSEEHILYGGKVKLTIDGRHVYRANGKVVNGVTTLLGVLNKPMLIGWASKEAVKEMGWYEKELWSPDGYVPAPEPEQAEGLARLTATLEHFKLMKPEEYWEALNNAKNAHRRKKELAADTGTLVHLWIENYIKGLNPEMPSIPQVKNGVEAFLKWVNENKVAFKLSENKVYSKKYSYAGTLDWTAQVNGVATMGDVKTSNFFNPEMFWQISAYQFARQEEYPEEKYDQQVIVRCGKDGALEVFESKDYQKNIKAFLACRAIYNRQKETLI